MYLRSIFLFWYIHGEPDNGAVFAALSKLRHIVDSSPELQEAKDEYNRLVCSLSKPSDLDSDVRNGLYEMLTGNPGSNSRNRVLVAHRRAPPASLQATSNNTIRIYAGQSCKGESKDENGDQRTVKSSQKVKQNAHLGSYVDPLQKQVCSAKSSNGKDTKFAQQPSSSEIQKANTSGKFTIQVPKQTLDLWKSESLEHQNGAQSKPNDAQKPLRSYQCDKTDQKVREVQANLSPSPQNHILPTIATQSSNMVPPHAKNPTDYVSSTIFRPKPASGSNGHPQQCRMEKQRVKSQTNFRNNQLPINSAIDPNSGGKRNSCNLTSLISSTKKVNQNPHISMSVTPQTVDYRYNQSRRDAGPFLPPPAIYYIQPPTTTVTQTLQLPPQIINHTFIPRMRNVNQPPQTPTLNINDIKKAFKDLICNIPRPKPIVIREKPNTVIVTQTVSQPAVTLTNTSIDTMLSKQQIELNKIFTQIARLYDLIRKGLRFTKPGPRIPVKLVRSGQKTTNHMDFISQTKTIASANPPHQKSCVCPVADRKIHPDRTGCYDIYTNGCHCILCYPGHTETKYKTRTVVQVHKNNKNILTVHREENVPVESGFTGSGLPRSDGYRYLTTYPPEFSDYVPVPTQPQISTQTKSETGKLCSEILSVRRGEEKLEDSINKCSPGCPTFCHNTTINGIECDIYYPGTTSTRFKTRTVIGKGENYPDCHAITQKSTLVDFESDFKIPTDDIGMIKQQNNTVGKEIARKSSETVCVVSTTRKTQTVVRTGECKPHVTETMVSPTQSCKTKIKDATTYIECVPNKLGTASTQESLVGTIQKTSNSTSESQSCLTSVENGTTHIFCVPSTMVPDDNQFDSSIGSLEGQASNVSTATNDKSLNKSVCSQLLKEGNCEKNENSVSAHEDFAEDTERGHVASTLDDYPIAKTINSKHILDKASDNSDEKVAVIFLDRRDSSGKDIRPLLYDTKNNVILDDNILLHLDSISDLFPAIDENDNSTLASDLSSERMTDWNSSIQDYSQGSKMSTILADNLPFSASHTLTSSKTSRDISNNEKFSRYGSARESDGTYDDFKVNQEKQQPQTRNSSRDTLSEGNTRPVDVRTFDYGDRSHSDHYVCTDAGCFNYDRNASITGSDSIRLNSHENRATTRALDMINRIKSTSQNNTHSKKAVTTSCNSVGCYEIEVLTRTLPFPTITNSATTNAKCDITKIVTLDEIDYENGSTIIETITDLDLDDLFDKIETETTTSYYIEGGDDIEEINKNIGERIFSPTVNKGALVKTGDNEFEYIERSNFPANENGQKKGKLYISDLPIFHERGQPIRRGDDLTSKTIIKKLAHSGTQDDADRDKSNDSFSPTHGDSRKQTVCRGTNGFEDPVVTDSNGSSLLADPLETFEQCGKKCQKADDDEYVLLSDIFSDRYRRS